MQWSRKRCMQVVSMAAVVSQSSWTTVASQAAELQPAPAWILQAFAGPSTPETVGDRPRALQEIRSSEALRENDQVRMALLTALDRANAEYRAFWRGDAPEYSEGRGEFLLDLVETVESLEDSRAIPALVRSIHTGRATMRALADFGEQALDPMVTAWEERPTIPSAARAP